MKTTENILLFFIILVGVIYMIALDVFNWIKQLWRGWGS